MQHPLFTSVLFVTAAVTAGISIPAWQRRHWSGGSHLALLMGVVSIWSFAVGAESLATEVSLKIVWSQVEYIGYGLTGTLFLLFVLHYTKQTSLLTPPRMALLFVMPVTAILLAWTNSLHNLVWSGFTYIEATNMLVYHRGPWFWVIAAYTYLLSFLSIAALVRARAKACTFHRKLYSMIIISSAFPLLTGFLYLAGWAPVRGMGITPLGFAVTGCIISWSLYHHQLLGLIPVGRALVLQNMAEGVVVLDSGDRIVDINPVAKQYLSPPAESLIGCSIDTAFASSPEITTLLEQLDEGSGEVSTFENEPRHIEISISPIRVSRRQRGRLVILRDVTVQKQAERDRERVIGDLKQALAHIKTLQGLLPICSVCKKIRDENGSWHTIESYIRDHTGAEFSHGFCPECSSKYYPSLFEQE